MSVRQQLRAHIDARRHDPFAYGTRDCCLMAADAWLAMRGADFAADLRGYQTQFGALRALKRAGFDSVADFVASRCRRVRRATFGIVVLSGRGPLHTLLIAEDALFAWGQGADGLVLSAMPHAATFWEPI